MNKKGIVYLGNRNTGKTTRLWNVYKRALHEEKTILIIDSATEHIDKSIFIKAQQEAITDIVKIYSCKEEKIIFPYTIGAFYPSGLFNRQLGHVCICDASYYLEKGYDFPAGKLREQQRLLYKKFSMQVIEAFLSETDIIIMDEIELIPESRRTIERIYDNEIELYMSLHEEDGLCGMADLLQIERT